MIAYLPTPYPDELAFSWFSRYYVHTGCLTHKAALQEILAKRCNNPSKEFLGQLSQGAKGAIKTMMPLEDIVLQHTMFPQYGRFVPMRKAVLDKLLNEVCDPNHLFGSQPRTKSERWLRYCPICAQEDRSAYGEAYWHRKHQIRGMTVCTKHRCYLENSKVTATSEQGFTLAPAELHIQDAEPMYTENLKILQFAEYMVAVFDAPMNLEQDTPISAILYDGMRKTKYLKSSGRCRYTKTLSEDMATFYEDMGLTDIATMSQIQRVLLNGGADFCVVCQLAYFLGMSVKDLTTPALTTGQIAAEQEAHYIRNRIPVDWADFDSETATLLEPLAQSIYEGTYREDGRPERVSERLIYRELALQKHRLENMPQCRAIMQQYYETYEQHWARRLVWAYQKLKKECGSKTFFWVNLRRTSGVKERNLAKVVPLICDHTDAETAAVITQMVQQSIPKTKGAARASHI